MKREKERLALIAYWLMSNWHSTPHEAVARGDIASLRAAIASGADLRLPESNRYATELAVEFKSAEALDMLLSAGGPQNAFTHGNNHGFPLAALAAAWDWPEGLDILRRHGADMNPSAHKGFGSPIRAAVAYNHLRCASKLIEWKMAGSIEAPLLDHHGISLLGECAIKDHVRMARLLHSALPGMIESPDKTGLRPVHLAALNANHGMLSWLAESGADFTALDAKGRDPIACARVEDKPKTVRFIQELIAKTQARALEACSRAAPASRAKPRALRV